jgi:hypothetical protein
VTLEDGVREWQSEE